MKRVYIGILVIASLVLAACGDTAPAPDEVQTDVPALSAADLGIESTELSVQAGNPVSVANVIGQTVSLGTDGQEGEGSLLLRHFDFLARIEEVTTENIDDALFLSDVTWRFVEPLADGADETCFSLESVNLPEHYLRHSRTRVRLDPVNTSIDAGTFEADATWCARTAFDGSAVEDDIIAIESFNFPGHYMRRFDDRVWLASRDGPLPPDTSSGFDTDTTWNLFAAPFD